MEARSSPLGQILPWVVLLSACAAQGTDSTPGDGAVSFGLGDKADGACDESSLLCWPTAHEQAARQLIRAGDELLLGSGDPHMQSQAMIDALTSLAPKLDAGERDALGDLVSAEAEMPAAPGPEERLSLFASSQGVAARVLTGYYAAHAVPLAAAAEAGAADGALVELPEVAGLTPDMQASLDALRDAGPFGYAYALLLEHTGVLELDYAVLSERYPFSEPREQRIERIIDHYRWASVRAAGIANLESLIPYAGVVLSMTHGSVMQFRLRARMVFEIAAVYGLDIRTGDNLLLAAAALMGTYELTEIQGLVAAGFAIPVLEEAVLRLGHGARAASILRALLGRLIARLLARVSTRGAELVASLSARAAARGAGRQVLGWATFGLAVIADVTLTAATTVKVGRAASMVLRPWGSGSLHDMPAVLVESGGASCIALLLGDAIGADGRVDGAERALFAAHLEREVYAGSGWSRLNTVSDMEAQAALAAWVVRSPDTARRDLAACMDSDLVGREPVERMAVLSWFMTMAAIDGEVSETERARYEAHVDRLRGDSWFGDGDELEEAHLQAMEERIRALLVEPQPLVDESGALVQLAPQDVIAGLDAPHTEGEASIPF